MWHINEVSTFQLALKLVINIVFCIYAHKSCSRALHRYILAWHYGNEIDDFEITLYIYIYIYIIYKNIFKIFIQIPSYYILWVFHIPKDSWMPKSCRIISTEYFTVIMYTRQMLISSQKFFFSRCHHINDMGMSVYVTNNNIWIALVIMVYEIVKLQRWLKW